MSTLATADYQAIGEFSRRHSRQLGRTRAIPTRATCEGSTSGSAITSTFFRERPKHAKQCDAGTQSEYPCLIGGGFHCAHTPP